MGKYKNSDLHDKYSDWHYKLIEIDGKYAKLLMCDIDRLWFEYQYKKGEVIDCFIIDTKYDKSIDDVGGLEAAVYRYLEKKEIPVYIVYITEQNNEFIQFRVIRFKDNKERIFTPMQYANWLLEKHKQS